MFPWSCSNQEKQLLNKNKYSCIIYDILFKMMSGSKAPDFDAYGLFRAAHSHFYAPLRSVLNMCHWHL